MCRFWYENCAERNGQKCAVFQSMKPDVARLTGWFTGANCDLCEKVRITNFTGHFSGKNQISTMSENTASSYRTRIASQKGDGGI
ncbi:hypothetical protein DRY71_26150 [Salmonella enterica subsp. enterica serovar Newport]|uniref:Uncharacterized protein n=1 Tax=Salmonella newport TaxID=108619 RepID=A0A5U9KYG1_SALNE|nr:hypothetical protein [Salmonella enterica subsp. enterica serovar Newport]